ncbi:MAG: efflux RND transporter periplasmic adaptor subunit [Treponema sp.]|jgi:multidrug efflux pump subunit AcrA (membrane-fusion protein)|nr:efflux RND transporter periplasmic adaptor subunit [Treponema sp.]
MTKGKGRKMAAAAAAALIAGVLILGPSLLAGEEKNEAAGEKGEAPVFPVKTVSAERRTLRAFLEVNGDIVSGQQADVFPDTPGKLIAVRAALGSRVRKGELIAEIDPSKPGMTYMPSPVYAPISGIVSRTPVSAGMTVGTGTSITTISVIENLEITARIPERKVAGLEEGLKSEVSLQAYPGEIFTATVAHVSPVIDSASRTKLITLKFDGYDRRVNAGMFARLRINTINYPGILAVPAEAVVNKHGESVVYVTRGGRAELRRVAAGVTLNGLTEITSGLSAGETVVVQGQQLLSGGEAVRVIGGGEA